MAETGLRFKTKDKISGTVMEEKGLGFGNVLKGNLKQKKDLRVWGGMEGVEGTWHSLHLLL